MADDIAAEVHQAQNDVGANVAKSIHRSSQDHQETSHFIMTALDLFGRFFSSGIFFMIVGASLLGVAYRTIGTTHVAMSLVFVVLSIAFLLFGIGTQGVKALDLIGRFFNSGVFFMIVGTGFLGVAYYTIGATHTAISFVFVVLGVAILLFGTGTQGVGRLDSSSDVTQAYRYQVVLAGGAGVTAFCIAAGMIGFAPKIKETFSPRQTYLRLLLFVDSFAELEHYSYKASINGARVPTVQHEDHLEILAPYLPTSEEKDFNIDLRMQLLDPTLGYLNPTPSEHYEVILKNNRNIWLNGTDVGKFEFDVVDTPQYSIPLKIRISKGEGEAFVAGQKVQ